MFKIIFHFIRKFLCVRQYHGTRKERAVWKTTHETTKSHIRWSAFLATLTAPLPLIHHGAVPIFPIVGLCFGVFMEILFQYHKEKDKPLWNVAGQIWERNAAFVLLSPVWLTCFVLSFKWSVLP